VKIFWSWQSDTPGRIGRHFVRETLELVVKELQAELELEEPDRELHLDHDRKGVSGSPDLATTILEKIRASSVFIADVTPVGQTSDGKSMLNPNVAIELGYALAHVGDQGFLMVLNSEYGDRESLPFDLKHKAGPIIFSLAPDASKEVIGHERRSLLHTMKIAIRDCIAARKRQSPTIQPTHVEIEPADDSSVYFKYGEALGERDLNGRVLVVKYDPDPLLYLRVIPRSEASQLKQKQIKDILYYIKISPFRTGIGGGAGWERNRFGGLTFSYEEGPDGRRMFTTSQVFPNREIWGLDATLLSGPKTIPSIALEELIESALKHYLDVSTKLMGLEPPFLIEAGASGVRGFTMAMGSDRYGGPIFQDSVKSRHELGNAGQNDVNEVLLAIFEDFFDAVGEARPKNFRGFPPDSENKGRAADNKEQSV
jgi:hypothetical protein